MFPVLDGFMSANTTANRAKQRKRNNFSNRFIGIKQLFFAYSPVGLFLCCHSTFVNISIRSKEAGESHSAVFMRY